MQHVRVIPARLLNPGSPKVVTVYGNFSAVKFKKALRVVATLFFPGEKANGREAIRVRRSRFGFLHPKVQVMLRT